MKPTIVYSTDEPGALVGDWIVALGLCVVVVPVAHMVFTGERFSGESLLKWILGVFLLCSVLALGRVALRSVGVLRFGHIRLRLRASPVRIGGALEGELEFPRKAASLKDVVATVACVRIRWNQTSSGASRYDEDVWTAQQRLVLVPTGSRGRAHLRFDIPAGQPDSHTRQWPSRNVGPIKTFEHVWELRLKAAAPGLTLERRFPIDVQPP